MVLWHDAEGEIVECEQKGMARHQLSKHTPTATYMRGTTEELFEAAIPAWFMMKPRNEDQ
jgi:hypothetical protein